MSCYNFEDYTFTDGLLDVNATYVLHLIGNGRYDSTLKSLKEYHISNKVHILMNQGYQKCNKPTIDNPPLDLIGCFLTVFKHAKENGYETILVLEDDFIFDEKIKQQYHRNNVNTFLKNHTEAMIYYLGTIPHVSIPYTFTTYRCISSTGTHAVIYNKQHIDKILNDKRDKKDWDFYHNTSGFCRYMYYTPLCYQLFANTDNSRYWGYQNPFYFWTAKFFKQFLRLLKLDKQIQPGYNFYYTFSKLWILLLFLLLFNTRRFWRTR